MSQMPKVTVFVAMYALTYLLLLTNTHADDNKLKPDGRTSANSQQVIIRTQLIEIDRNKLRKLGVDFAAYEGEQVVSKNKSVTSIFHVLGKTKTGSIASSSPAMGFLDALRKNGIARIISETRIATLDGRPASLSSGSNVRIDDRQGVHSDSNTTFIGTKVDAVPHIVQHNRVRIEIRVSSSSLDEIENDDKSDTFRKVRHQLVDTGFEIEFGATFLCAGLNSSNHIGEQTKETELIFLVTPKLVSSSHTGKQSTVSISKKASAEKKYK